MKHWKTENGLKSSLCTDPPPLRKNRRRGPFSDFSKSNHRSLFLKRSTKMIDCSEIRRRELAFELQSSRVFEKRSKSSDVFEQVNRKWAFSSTNMPWHSQICTAKCPYSKETTCPRICSKSRPKSANSPLPVGVRRSKTLNDEIKVWATALVRCNHALKSHACIYIYIYIFSAVFAGPRFVEIQVMLPWQREVTLFISITYHKKFNQRLYFSLLLNLV